MSEEPNNKLDELLKEDFRRIGLEKAPEGFAMRVMQQMPTSEKQTAPQAAPAHRFKRRGLWAFLLSQLALLATAFGMGSTGTDIRLWDRISAYLAASPLPARQLPSLSWQIDTNSLLLLALILLCLWALLFADNFLKKIVKE